MGSSEVVKIRMVGTGTVGERENVIVEFSRDTKVGESWCRHWEDFTSVYEVKVSTSGREIRVEDGEVS